MKKLILSLALLLTVGTAANAQFAVIDPTNLIQNTIGAVQGVSTAANMIKNFQECVKIYEQGKKYTFG